MKPVLEVKALTHTYSAGTPFEHKAIDNVDLEVMPGEFLGIIGHTGSGKSTLIQHLNGLLRPTDGQILLDVTDIWERPKEIRKVRFQVGLVFQYPEYQLFEETVYKDISFGPKNMGLEGEEIDCRVRRAAAFAGIDEEMLEKSPFELSGGQKRRVAIAGVIAMEPKVLILDEPTAGLDPRQSSEMRALIKSLAGGRTVVFSSHILSEVQAVCDRIIILHHGKMICDSALQALRCGERRLRARIACGEGALLPALRALQSVSRVQVERGGEPGVTQVVLTAREGAQIERELFTLLSGLQMPLLRLSPVEDSLEEIFLRATGGAD